MSYCSLEEAFPQTCDNKEPSCWSQNTDNVSQPIIKVGAQVSKVQQPSQQNQPSQVQPTIVFIPPYQQNDHHHHKQNKCMSHLHHCMSCPTCFQLLQLYFANQNPTLMLGAQASPSLQVQTTPKRKSILLEPMFEGSPITWGTVLTIMAGGTLLLLIMEISKRMK